MLAQLQEVVQKFGNDLEKAARGDYDDWATRYDKLARIILTDQLTR